VMEEIFLFFFFFFCLFACLFVLIFCKMLCVSFLSVFFFRIGFLLCLCFLFVFFPFVCDSPSCQSQSQSPCRLGEEGDHLRRGIQAVERRRGPGGERVGLGARRVRPAGHEGMPFSTFASSHSFDVTFFL
jgi:hypothetical protein